MSTGSPSVSLNHLLERIKSEEDKVLFQEAIASAHASALRAAYVMVWTSCAESLKRKFRDLAARDGTAKRVSGEIERREANQQSVDKYILDESKNYGLISATDHVRLEHVYTMRCLFGHPYEKQPLPEEVRAAAEVVVETVLGVPTKLRHGYLSEQVRLLTEEATFLDDIPEPVNRYALDVFHRASDDLLSWFIEKLWGKAEDLVNDPTKALFVRRTVWFSRAFLGECAAALLSAWDTVGVLTRVPVIASSVLSHRALFVAVSNHARDIIVGNLLTALPTQTDYVENLQSLHRSSSLSARQAERFLAALKQFDVLTLVSLGVHAEYIATRLIEDLKSHTWPTQNPAVKAVKTLGPKGIGVLQIATQRELGANILQAADGNATAAVNFLREIPESPGPWPPPLIEGIVAECFINDADQVRFKLRRAHDALRCLKALPVDESTPALARLAARIVGAKLKYQYEGPGDRDKAVTLIESIRRATTELAGPLEPVVRSLASLEFNHDEP